MLAFVSENREGSFYRSLVCLFGERFMSDGIDWRRPSGAAAQAPSVFHSNILVGKTALVTGEQKNERSKGLTRTHRTGGGSGIGLEIATQLGLHGAKIAIMVIFGSLLFFSFFFMV